MSRPWKTAGGEEKWPRFFESPSLRHPDEDGGDGKAAKYFCTLRMLPNEMQNILTGAGLPDDQKALRPTLRDFVGFQRKFLHKNRELTKMVFVWGMHSCSFELGRIGE